MPRQKVLLDVTHVYDEEGGIEQVGDMPNIYDDEATPSGEPPPYSPFLPGYALEIPREMKADAASFEEFALRDDDAAPNGNARLTDRIPENREFLRFLLERDAEIYTEGFEVDYLETAETIGFEPKGPWSGYRSRNLAFFLKEEDARGYEEALQRYQAPEPETGKAA
ncbi:hypothetical protein [Candidatus Manganitrophus noduliformans]|uniref:Uncharacterized protein n=1 Tax=Candidatus Manganitrophus noduliformans TaxID=2606439 RepID=A0A7X6I9Q6_9BACT|nr:hypothetical protein [Candidatus Manganitrophus noduliformans]NKE69564.1 hypothetical protein [Candidatus Manganitrophus noduliformans]